MTSTDRKYWLMKAEPDSRIVKGKDVKVRVFSKTNVFQKCETRELNITCYLARAIVQRG